MHDKRNTQNFEELLHRYKNGTCTPKEVKDLFGLLKSDDSDPLIDAELKKEFDLLFDTHEKTEKLPAKVFRLPAFRKFAVASAASIVILFALYFFFNTVNSDKNIHKLVLNEVKEVTDQKKVVLTIDNGKKFILDSASIGEITVQSGMTQVMRSRRMKLGLILFQLLPGGSLRLFCQMEQRCG